MEKAHIMIRTAQARLLTSAAGAVLAYVLLQSLQPQDIALVGMWDTFAGVLLAISAYTFSHTTPVQLRKVATSEDSNRTVIFLLVLFAACVSLLAVLYLIKIHEGSKTVIVPVSLLAVGLSWGLVHTTFCYRYAHTYYDNHPAKAGMRAGGIDFPKDQDPDYWDFAYLAFTIGMTAQVSDTDIESKPIRRMVLTHSLISFFYNTIIIAFTISIVSGVI